MAQATVVPSEQSFEGLGGLKIFFRSWLPAGTPKATLAICHGFNAHGGQYGWVAEQFVEDSVAVYALDLRGRGKSAGERFYVENFSDYVDDLSRLVDIAIENHPGVPVFLLGHSAGGVISTGYVIDNQQKLAGFICESFAHKVPAPDIVLGILKGVSRIAPHFGVFKLNNRDFSRDPAVVSALNADPLIANETQPANTVAEMARANQRHEEEFRRITLPLLIIHGTEDRATMPAGSRSFHEKAASVDKTLKLYEGHFHDLLTDIGKENVMADIKAWIAQRIPA